MEKSVDDNQLPDAIDAVKDRPATSDESGGDGEATVTRLDTIDNANSNSLQNVASQRSVATNTLSRARSVALVATVTGAAFLNASLLSMHSLAH